MNGSTNKKSFQSFVCLGVMLLLGCSTHNDESFDRSVTNFNLDWTFMREDTTRVVDAHTAVFDDSKWDKVSLPHTAKVEPAIITEQQWQGTCWYRKTFTISSASKGKHLALYFEGAMHTAGVWINGKKIKTHKGGYLPFYVELTDNIEFGKENSIAIRLNNEDNEEVPPGKPIAGLDFNYYGGLYRNVRLVEKNKIHITNPIQSDIVAGGGVFVKTLKADANEAVLDIKTDVLNQTESGTSLIVKNSIYNPLGVLVASASSVSKAVGRLKTVPFNAQIKLEKPALWRPEVPNLYTAKIDLIRDGIVIDSENITFGIRLIQFDKKGFRLNGKPYKLRGTNRHQDYPYLGYALSDNAQYRDAYKIKQAGFNFVRLSHYPHSEAFMDACDALGIMVMDAIPGWQFFGGEAFQNNCYDDIRQLARRDRHHPSVILWEASLNESGMTKAFMAKAHAIVHEELPEKNIYTCGWIDDAYDVFIPARQHAKAPDYWKKYDGDRPLFIAEYGDWEYYAQNAGFNQTAYGNLKEEERTSRQLRGDGQIRLTQQALNYQESHNDNLYNVAAGDANWLMFDYNRGYAPDIESSGVMDIFRLPKFAYYFYASQKALDQKNPVLFIANYWDDPQYNMVKIYSNCDEVELWLNGKLIGKRQSDTDRNSTNLLHPPFTFEAVGYANGVLEAKGFYKGELVASTKRVTPDAPAKIDIRVDESNMPIEANCNDVVFVYATIRDAKGHSVPTAVNKVLFKIEEGDAKLIGDNPAVSEAGIATILMRAETNKGNIIVSAFSEGLQSDTLNVAIGQ